VLSCNSSASTQERVLEHAGARLRYRDEGAGPAIVLVHGWALDLEMWEPQATVLARRFRVLRMDRRGFGRSSGRPALAADALDIIALLDHVRVSQTAIIGMSQGARIAIDLACRAAGRLTCLVIDGAPASAPTLGLDGLREIPIAQYQDIFASRGIEALRAAIATHPLLQLASTEQSAHEILARVIARYPGNDLLTEFPADRSQLPAKSLEGFLAMSGATLSLLRLPTLVVNGELDTPHRLQAGDAICAALLDCQRALVPHAGHLANLDNPTQYNFIVTQFLARHLTRTTTAR
jgi:pimeloyl-ACP methyl ester carboxylesterase